MKGIFPIDKFRTLQTPFYYYDTKVLRDTLSAINQEAVSYTHLGFFGCRREDYSVCHAASDDNLIGSSDDDGTELRSRTYTTDEPLSGFGDRNCTCFRCIGLCVFTIPAGNAYRCLLYTSIRESGNDIILYV